MTIWWIRVWILFLVYSVLRLLFFLFNYHALSGLPRLDIIAAFLIGLRFDLCVIATINTAIFAIDFLCLNFLRGIPLKISSWLMNVCFVGLNLPIIVISFVDNKLFTFTGRRTSPELFSISADLSQQAIPVILDYWPLTLVGLLICLGFVLISWNRNYHNLPSKHSKGKWVLFISAFSLLTFVSIRGGWQRKPLAPAHAYHWQPPVLSNLVLNSGMTLLKSPPSKAVNRYHDYIGLEEIKKNLGPDVDPKATSVNDSAVPGKNVVVLIVESLASEYVGALNQGVGYTPFLDSLIAQSLSFPESFANGRRSIDAMPSIFATVPPWREEPFVTSAFSGNDIQALPHILKTQGYETYFFHGAPNGSMHFDVFASIAGIGRYIGLSEFPTPGFHDGSWGIYDEPFLSYSLEVLDQSKKPFFAGIFTLSSHSPFAIPKGLHKEFPKGTLPIHESIGYADYSLETFFELAKSKEWYKDTLFIVTGDHTSLSDSPSYNNFLGRYRVPVVYFDPSNKISRKPLKKITQHLDITPSVLDALQLRQNKPSLLGQSVFDSRFPGQFVQYEYGFWYLYDGEEILRGNEQNDFQTFSPKDHNFSRGSPPAADHKNLKKLKALRQYYTNGLIDNSWHK